MDRTPYSAADHDDAYRRHLSLFSSDPGGRVLRSCADDWVAEADGYRAEIESDPQMDGHKAQNLQYRHDHQLGAAKAAHERAAQADAQHMTAKLAAPDEPQRTAAAQTEPAPATLSEIPA